MNLFYKRRLQERYRELFDRMDFKWALKLQHATQVGIDTETVREGYATLLEKCYENYKERPPELLDRMAFIQYAAVIRRSTGVPLDRDTVEAAERRLLDKGIKYAPSVLEDDFSALNDELMWESFFRMEDWFHGWSFGSG